MEVKVLGILSALLVLMMVGTFTVSAVDTTNETRLKIATTTSLYDTGLLNYIQTKYQDEYGTPLSIVSGGTGIAIQYGQRGDVDLLVIHDKARELKFVQDGDGLQRRCIAYNYFVIVGPKDDPAGIKGMNATQAFKTILEKGQAEPDQGQVRIQGRQLGHPVQGDSALEGGRLQLLKGQQLRSLVHRCRTGNGSHTDDDQ